MKYILPVCIVIIIGMQLFDYFVNGEFDAVSIAMACILIPAAIKGVKPKYAETVKFKSVSKIFLIIGIAIFLLVILNMLK